ncbi:MAG: hydrogenase maturation nickel metallochaperone HypA/HybF [Candidatus Heimdallarchaeaceae archaeon]
MHEYSLASAIVKQVKQIALEHKATKVNKVTVSADPYEMIIPELLQDAFKIISSELEIFESAQLEILRLPAEITCIDCDYKGEPTGEGDAEFAFNFKCPKCDSRDTHLNIRHLTIETVDLKIPE